MAEGFEGPQQDRELSGGARGALSQARENAASTGRDLLDRAVEKKDELKQRATGAVDDQRMHAVGRVDAISRALHGAVTRPHRTREALTPITADGALRAGR